MGARLVTFLEKVPRSRFQLDIHNRFTLVNCFELFEFKRPDVSGFD